MPWQRLPDTALPTIWFDEDASSRMSSSVFQAVLPITALADPPSRKMSRPKPLTRQFWTVTPVLLGRYIPIQPGPVTLWPAQSRVMPSAAIVTGPAWSSVSVVLAVIVSGPEPAETGVTPAARHAETAEITTTARNVVPRVIC